MLQYIYILVVKYYIGTEDSEEEDAVHEKTNKPPGFNDVGVVIEKPKTDDTSNDKHKQAESQKSNAASNPWTQMANSIQSEDLQSFHGVKRSLAKSLLASGHHDGFDIAYQMVRSWCNANYNLPRLKKIVAKTENQYLFPPKDPIESDHEKSRSTGSKIHKKPSYLFDTLVYKLKNYKDTLTNDQIEFCVRKTMIYLMIGTEGATKGKSKFDEWKASQEPTKRTKKNQNKPDVPENEIVYNYLPPGLRQEEAINHSLTQNLDEISTKPDLPANEKENHCTDNAQGILLELCNFNRISKFQIKTCRRNNVPNYIILISY